MLAVFASSALLTVVPGSMMPTSAVATPVTIRVATSHNSDVPAADARYEAGSGGCRQAGVERGNAAVDLEVHVRRLGACQGELDVFAASGAPRRQDNCRSQWKFQGWIPIHALYSTAKSTSAMLCTDAYAAYDNGSDSDSDTACN